MRLEVWDTRLPAPDEFGRAWRAALAACPHANFTLRPDYLAWESERGRHALAVLARDGGRSGALVLREQGRTLVSGWPWRWQTVVEEGGEGGAAGLTADEAAWLFEVARRIAGGRRLRMLLPVRVPARRGGFHAGATLLCPTGADDTTLLARLDVNKRRAVKRARREGWEVREARTVEERRAFAVIKREVDLAHGLRVPPVPEEVPAPCEGWREWELPWMWLLVAVREGVVGAGSGFGVSPGGTVEYRANGSSAEARRAGVNALLAWEALRGGRERGCRWMNWGGVTDFKQEMGGERVDVHCRLGGGAAWALPNAAAAGWHGAGRQLRSLARGLLRPRGRRS